MFSTHVTTYIWYLPKKSKFSLYFILYLKKIYEKSFSHASTGLDPEGSFTGGGALQAEDLNRVAQAVSGVRKPLLIGGGSGVLPREKF